MVTATLLFAAIPVAMVFVGVKDSPLWMGASITFGSALGSLLYIIAKYSRGDSRGLIRHGFATTFRSKTNPKVLLAVLSFFSTPLLALAIPLAGAAPAVLLYEMYPLFFVLVSSAIARDRERTNPTDDIFRQQLLLLLILYVIATVIIGSIMMTFAMIAGEPPDIRIIFGGLLVGAIFRASGSISWRLANQMAFSEGIQSLGINSLSYFGPLITLLALALLGEADVQRPDYLTIGAVAIVVANITLNGVKEIGPAFQATLVTLWGAATIVYMRTDSFQWSGHDYWGVLGLLATILALMLAFRMQRVISISTDEERRFFKLVQDADLLWRRRLLYVRPDKVHIEARESYEQVFDQPRERTDQKGEDWQELWHDFQKEHSLATREALKSRLVRIDTPRDYTDLRDAYDDITIPLWEARIRRDITDAERANIAEFSADLDGFVTSKRHEWNFGEFFVIIMFAIATCSLALLAFPQVSGPTGLFADAISALICAGFTFLVFNMWELQQVRNHPWLSSFDHSRELSEDGKKQDNKNISRHSNNSYRRSVISTGVLMLLGAAGVMFIVFSQTEIGASGSDTYLSLTVVFGMILALLSAVIAGCASFDFSWVEETWPTSQDKQGEQSQQHQSKAAGREPLSADCAVNKPEADPKIEDQRFYTLNFSDQGFQVAGSRSARWLGSLLVMGISMSFGILLWDKWLG